MYRWCQLPSFKRDILVIPLSFFSIFSSYWFQWKVENTSSWGRKGDIFPIWKGRGHILLLEGRGHTIPIEGRWYILLRVDRGYILLREDRGHILFREGRIHIFLREGRGISSHRRINHISTCWRTNEVVRSFPPEKPCVVSRQWDPSNIKRYLHLWKIEKLIDTLHVYTFDMYPLLLIFTKADLTCNNRAILTRPLTFVRM